MHEGGYLGMTAVYLKIVTSVGEKLKKPSFLCLTNMILSQLYQNKNVTP